MTDTGLDTLLLQHAIEQFYYREARLLDNRQYQSWLALCSPEIRYTLPARGNPLVNNRDSGNEAMISVERELETADDDRGSPVRDEGYAQLYLRVERSFKKNSWAENPPARTRRLIGNVEILEDDGQALIVNSHFHLHYARPGGRDFQYAGERRDRLQRTDDGFMLLSRRVVMDVADIDLPTLGLFF